jgi:exodeoxyribonuclease VIII
MLDLETFGNGNDAVIVSIGAVKFDADNILDEFHVGVEPTSCTQLGLRLDVDTILWWMHPDRGAARDALLSLERVDLPSALQGFAQWYADVPTLNGDVPFPGEGAHVHGAELPIWGNGATFDNVILRSAYRVCGMTYPARFWNDRCYRTVKGLAPEIQLVREGTHHDACDDARCQAKHLQAIAKHLNIAL